jgi:hypothetical protein
MTILTKKDYEWHNPKEELPTSTTNIEFIDSSDNVRKGEIVVEMSGFYLYIEGEGWDSMDNIKQWRFV